MAASVQSLQKVSTAGLLLRIWQSSLGKKYVMAVTGIGLFLFVIIHMLGNLQIFLGPEKLNAYAALLKSNPAILWGARIGLLAIVVLHVTSAIQLALINKRARPVGYAVGKPVASTFAQRTILVSGLIILAVVASRLTSATPLSAAGATADKLPPGTVAPLGTALLSYYAVAVEVAGVLLLAAMVGAIAIARRRTADEMEAAT